MKSLLSYPFLYEESDLVEFEVLTDQLASILGLCVSYAKDYNEFYNELVYICEIAYHLNGSIRGKQAIYKDDIDFLIDRYKYYENLLNDGTRFVLPTGGVLASNLHIARSKAKEVVRKVYKLSKNGIEIDKIIFDCANMISNYCFIAALYANKIEGIEEIEFKSRSYK